MQEWVLIATGAVTAIGVYFFPEQNRDISFVRDDEGVASLQAT